MVIGRFSRRIGGSVSGFFGQSRGTARPAPPVDPDGILAGRGTEAGGMVGRATGNLGARNVGARRGIALLKSGNLSPRKPFISSSFHSPHGYASQDEPTDAVPAPPRHQDLRAAGPTIHEAILVVDETLS
jgi:hypothetical protein